MTLRQQLPICRDFARRVDQRAEQDMLDGNPLAGAHHRAIRVELDYMERCEALGADTADGPIQNSKLENAK
ncbi:MAG: hypothetical protein HW378_175 [Anaerolineales bacterium]|nr:hypothetical protein [Anaerolineales bacterium]